MLFKTLRFDGKFEAIQTSWSTHTPTWTCKKIVSLYAGFRTYLAASRCYQQSGATTVFFWHTREDDNAIAYYSAEFSMLTR